MRCRGYMHKQNSILTELYFKKLQNEAIKVREISEY